MSENNVVSFPEIRRETSESRRDIEQEVLHALEAGLGALEDDLVSPVDREAIDDEDAFYRRFRFDAPRDYRRHLINLKHQADLTDREIRLLSRAGALKFDRATAAISAPLFLAAWGWFQLVSLSSLMLLGFLVASRVVAPTIMQITLLTAFESALLAVAWALLNLYVAPRRILNRVLRAGATK